MAHIAVTCPRCLSRFQVEPTLRGQHMRCPNSVCRAIFEVKDEAPAPPAPPSPPQDRAPKQVSGSVGQVVPILTAEVAEATPLPAPAPAESVVPLVSAEVAAEPEPPAAWAQAPPPVRHPAVAEETPARPAAKSQAAPVAPQPTEADDFLDQVPEEKTDGVAGGVREMGPGTWEAPPVRRSAQPLDGTHAPLPESTRAAPRLRPVDSPDGRTTRRRMRWLIAGLVLLLAGGLGGGFLFVEGTRAGSEAERFKKAKELYEERNFADAAGEMRNLLRDFPDSKNRSAYRFLAEWSDVRDAVYAGQTGSDELARALGRLLQFLKLYQDDALVKPYEGDIWLTLHKLVKELSAEADQQKDRGLLDKARRALAAARSLQPPSATNALDTTREAEAKLTDIDKQIVERERRLALVDRIKELVRKPSAQAVQDARLLVQNSGFKDDSELQELLKDVVRAHAASVTYTAVTASPETKAAAIDREPSYLVTPLLQRAAAAPGLETRSVFALARGVLHALDPRTGALRWARRVGVDTTLLPLRLPASPIAPEIALVLSSDSKTLSAVNADTGATIWEHQLQEACVGLPVLAGNRLLVPTYPGRVDEIEMSEGKLLGYYQLGQPLTVGGVLQKGTSLAYFPADKFTIYVLDVARHTCAQVLYSQHPSGSLRAAPIILAGPESVLDKKADSGFLILSQADGLDAVKLRAFRLPVLDPDDKSLEPEVKTRGWSWFPPFDDGERLGLATDAGVLALFGVRQKGNSRDPFLFPLIKDEVSLDSGTARFGRAQVVHADAENIWVLAHGRLQRLQLTFTRQAGPGILSRWPVPLALGSPLHAAQVHEDAAGKTVLFLVTQTQKGQTHLVSAVDARDGSIYWQRQLGLSIQAQPLPLGPLVLAHSQNGLFLFDTKEVPKTEFGRGGTLALAFPRGDNATRLVLAGDNATEAYVLSFARRELHVQLLRPGETKQQQPAHFPMPAFLGGTPALGKNCVVVPMDNGIPRYVPLGEGAAADGPDWRAAGAEVNARGHVVYLGAADFVMTDGSRGLHLVRWAEPKVCDKKASTQLARRIVAAPVVVPGNQGQKARLCVADAGDTLTLLEGDTLATIRAWRLPDKIAAGPFVRGRNIGCIVGNNRLVWFDPDKEQSIWEYAFPAQIVGEPQLAGDMLVVANLAGQFVALDPASGRPLGRGYTLRANVPPAAAPIAFGPDHLFAPLMDGTIMLLSRKLLRE